MFDFSYDKYRYFTDEKSKVVAVSTYAGKPVRGIAKCDPKDNFNIEAGRKLAAARCNLKIAIKRKENAYKQCVEADQKFHEAYIHMIEMRDYLTNATKACQEADEVLTAIETSLEN